MSEEIIYEINDKSIYLCLIGRCANYEDTIYDYDDQFDVIKEMLNNIDDVNIEFDEMDDDGCNYVENIIFTYKDEEIEIYSHNFVEYDPREREIDDLKKYIKKLERENKRLNQLLNNIEKDK